ncbi:MAG: carboxypeptidase-like regulatory domain-containing protein [Candidatus Binataceae bacterium]
MRLSWTVIASALLTVGLSAPALSATICGVARNSQGAPVSGATVTVKDNSGKTIGQAITDKDGHYLIGHLDSGPIDLFLSSVANYQAGSGALTLNDVGKSVNWNVSNSAPAMAVAGGTCADPAGLTAGDWASIGALGLGGAIIAGVTTAYLATNQSDHQNSHPVTSWR